MDIFLVVQLKQTKRSTRTYSSSTTLFQVIIMSMRGDIIRFYKDARCRDERSIANVAATIG